MSAGGLVPPAIRAFLTPSQKESHPISKRVLILSGSPRKHGNTDHMADEFARGAVEAGQAPDESYIYDMGRSL